MKRIIGIDLGTTNSCMAVLEGGAVQVIPNHEGGRTTPSVVAFTEKGDRLVGQIARRQAVTNHRNTIYAVKRLIGRKFSSPEVQQVRSLLPYELSEAKTGDVWIRSLGHDYSPPEISAFVLQRMKDAAEEYFSSSAMDAIITVPAYFDEVQRQATKDAGRIAGLNVTRIINEPTAAALAYGLGKKNSEKIAVYDLGGGTFDISILELNNGVVDVLATSGDSFLGGEDFDHRIADWITAEFKVETSIDLKQDRLALQRVKEAAEKAKCELSVAAEAQINLPFIASEANGPKHFNKMLGRSQLEQMTSDLVERTVEPCKRALADARLTPEQIDHIILVGGQTRMPMVRSRVESIFGKAPSRDINPDEVVAIGAAIQGGVLSGEIKDIILLDVIPLSLGLETQGGVFTKFLERNTTIPTKKTLIFTTVADGQSTVEIHVLQGERDIAAHNRSLGRFELVGIAHAPKGVPQIEVTFDVDADGLLSVSARDQLSGQAQAIKITPSGGLTQAEIMQMIEEANQFAVVDRKRTEETQLTHQLEGLLQNTKKSYEEFGWMLEKEEQQEMESRLAAARHVFETPNVEVLKTSLEEVERLAARLRQVLLSPPKGKKAPSETEHTAVGSDDENADQVARDFLRSSYTKKD